MALIIRYAEARQSCRAVDTANQSTALLNVAQRIRPGNAGRGPNRDSHSGSKKFELLHIEPFPVVLVALARQSGGQ